MKKFNITCILCILVALSGIIFNLCALETGIYPIYYKIMLIIDSILLGMVLGEWWMGYMSIKHKCNFENFKDKEEK